MNKLFSFIIVLFCFVFINIPANSQTNDFIVDDFLKDKNLEKPLANLHYNYESFEKIPIKLRINKNISTKKIKYMTTKNYYLL